MSGIFRCLLPSSNVKERWQKFISKYENSVNTFCQYCNALWMYIVCGVFFILLFVCMFVFSFCVLPFWWIKMYILIYCGSYCLRKSNKKADEKWLFWTHLVDFIKETDEQKRLYVILTMWESIIYTATKSVISYVWEALTAGEHNVWQTTYPYGYL